MFPPAGSNQTECTDVTIVSDGILEGEESFCLNLTSSDPDVNIEPTSMTTCIVIADSDSEYRSYFINHACNCVYFLLGQV